MGFSSQGSISRNPITPPEVQMVDSLDIVNRPSEQCRLTWFGHSAFLLEMDGKKILLDPMFGDTPAPHPWLGSKRYSDGLPIEIEKLPRIDFVIFSHDHYDHLDYGSIQKLKNKVGHFYVPLGVENHLIAWGVPASAISVLDWWDETNAMGIELICAPARHFSGRGLMDRASTLWCSWIIKGKEQKIYFSGDSGYGPHFKEVGDKHGPFDIALMECGQYNEQWEAIHMMPEQTAQAGVEVQAKMIMPIHWGAFTLALHSWTDPVERVLLEAKELDLPVATPIIGEPIIVGDSLYPKSTWWKDYGPSF